MASIATYCFALSEINIILALLASALFVVLANTSIKIPEQYSKYSITVITVVAAIEVFLTSQLMMDAGLKYIVPFGLVLSLLICFFVLQLCSLATGSCFGGILAGSSLLLAFVTVNYLVYMFRGTELTPFDFLAVETAMNVSGEYEYHLQAGFVAAWTIHLLFLVLLSDIDIPRIERNKELKIVLAACAAVVLTTGLLSNTVTSSRWGNQGSMRFGTFANFMLEVRESRVKKPSGYNAEKLSEEVSEYTDIKTTADEVPNIIVIMNESFADMEQNYSNIRTNEPILPYFDSLENNTIRGYAYSSVFGGNTSCSEFEFLTGNTMAFLPQGAIPYQQFVDNETFSMISVLKKLGYRCEAIHPFLSNGWNRDKTYPMLGFDRSYFLDDYPWDDTIRGYVTDKAMYKMIIDRFNKKPKNKPIFMFGVTIQNHGGYENESIERTITVKGHEGEFPEAEQYMTLMHSSDKALKYLIKQLKTVDEHTIVVFFGDHLPSLSEEFYEYASGMKADDMTLSDEMRKYRIPFVIWANYDIEPGEIDQTSLNYLGGYVLEVAGIHSAYGSFLQDVSTCIPVLNTKAYYSVYEKKFKELKEAEGKEYDMLELYRKIQYNNIVDKKNRLPLFSDY